MRTYAEKRHNDWKKAIRKRNITKTWHLNTDYYDNLHQYSKNKIHCSCPMCARKSNNKGAYAFYNGSHNLTIADRRRQEEMDDQLEDLTFSEIDV